MKWLLTILFIASNACATPARTGQVRVAVIDTGKPAFTDAPVCASGHKDFTLTTITDVHGHASHIADVIDQNVKEKFRTFYNTTRNNRILNSKVNYCIVFLKYYDEASPGYLNLARSVEAFKEAVQQNVDVIVYAGGGPLFQHDERRVVVKALDKGIKIIAAAGNEGVDTGIRPYFPAQYDSRIQMVGNMQKDGKRGPLSNFGKDVKYWEIGTNVIGKVNGKPVYMTGTSQATAVRAGKVVKEMLRGRK
jgi:subtilisin family serine protease